MMEMGMHMLTNMVSMFPFPFGKFIWIGDHCNEERAHVIADLMMRCSKKPKFLEVWGTGTCTREFLYIDDAVEGILSMVDASAGSFINIGSGQEVSILDLAKKIIAAYELDIDIVLNSSKPDGQPRKVMDVQKARQEVERITVFWRMA